MNTYAIRQNEKGKWESGFYRNVVDWVPVEEFDLQKDAEESAGIFNDMLEKKSKRENSHRQMIRMLRRAKRK